MVPVHFVHLWTLNTVFAVKVQTVKPWLSPAQKMKDAEELKEAAYDLRVVELFTDTDGS